MANRDTDTISRQDVISTINAMRERCDSDDIDDYHDLLVEAIEVLPPSPSRQQWIPCRERLPEDGTWNIFSDGKNISVERYKMDAIDHFFPQGRWFSFDKAIAWMPLPEPYQGN